MDAPLDVSDIASDCYFAGIYKSACRVLVVFENMEAGTLAEDLPLGVPEGVEGLFVVVPVAGNAWRFGSDEMLGGITHPGDSDCWVNAKVAWHKNCPFCLGKVVEQKVTDFVRERTVSRHPQTDFGVGLQSFPGVWAAVMKGLLVEDGVFDGAVASEAELIERLEHLQFVCVLA